MNKYSTVVSTIRDVARDLHLKNHEASAELYRIAQTLMDGQASMGAGSGMGAGMPGSSADFGFDPSQEMDGGAPQMQVLDMANRGNSNMHPGIESFVHGNPDGGAMVDDRKSHTLTCTLKAPKDISEAQMMNFILSIGPKLGVDVDSFKWSVADPKPSTGAR